MGGGLRQTKAGASIDSIELHSDHPHSILFLIPQSLRLASKEAFVNSFPYQSRHHATPRDMTSREDSVLAARDPSLTDENDWEEFSLSEVRVLVPGKSRYANLLTASPSSPVQVTGCLDEVEEEQESLGTYY